MAEFGTIEFYEEQLQEQRNEKTIYIHALKNLLREQDNRQDNRRYVDNYWLIDIIIEKIQSINYWIKSHIEKINELSRQKDKSETDAD